MQGLRLTEDGDVITGTQTTHRKTQDYTHQLLLRRASCLVAKKISCQENYAQAYHFQEITVQTLTCGF